MEIKLVKPTKRFKERALGFRQEFFDNGEMIINGSELFDKTDTYEEWLKSIKNSTISPCLSRTGVAPTAV